MILSAIDIGSNAARLLISEVIQSSDQPIFRKLLFVRVPLRLGMDVFENGLISEEKSDKLSHTIQAFAHLQKVYQVSHRAAVATSAMRDALNGRAIVSKINEEAGVQIQILSGEEEAELLLKLYMDLFSNDADPKMMIDVGGGSTEVCIFQMNRLLYRYSFNIGTIRWLQNKVPEEAWEEMKFQVKNNCRSLERLSVIGSGGNINKVLDISGKSKGSCVSISYLKHLKEDMEVMTIEQRMSRYDLKPDRAEVIVPGIRIYHKIMKWAGAEEIMIPKLGLSDAMVRRLYQQYSIA